jgi:hypothetical protein
MSNSARIGKTLKARQPWWLVLCWVTGGLVFAWRCAFEWFAGRYPPYSEALLRRMGLIVAPCAVLALIVAGLLRARLRDAGAVFFLISLLVYGCLSVWWIVHR